MDSSRKVFKFVMLSLQGICLALTSIWFYLGYSSQHRTTITLISNGYVGPVKIVYGVKDTPEIPTENGRYIFKIPISGLLHTSSDIDSGWGVDEYYYYDGDRRWRLHETNAPYNMNEMPPKGMVWGRNIEVDNKNQTSENYFIGDQEQYSRYQKNPNSFSNEKMK